MSYGSGDLVTYTCGQTKDEGSIRSRLELVQSIHDVKGSKLPHCLLVVVDVQLHFLVRFLRSIQGLNVREDNLTVNSNRVISIQRGNADAHAHAVEEI